MKLKPILIATEDGVTAKSPASSKLYRVYPETSEIRTNKGIDHVGYDIILIDPTAEIVERDLYYNNKRKDINISYANVGVNVYWDKIIASTNPQHNLPKLSQQSIDLLIEYYNVNGSMSESVDVIEMTGHIDVHNETIPDSNKMKLLYFDEFGIYSGIKLNTEGTIDVTIPRNEESQESQITYTEDEVKKLIIDALWATGDYPETIETEHFPDGTISRITGVDEWWQTNKK